MLRAFGWLIIVGGLVTVGLALCDYLAARWRAFLAAKLASLVAEERRKHAAELKEARRQHREAQLWLLETHQSVVDHAVAEALTNVAPDPMRRAS